MKRILVLALIAYCLISTAFAVWPCPCGCNEWWCKMSKVCVATQAHPGQHPCQKMAPQR